MQDSKKRNIDYMRISVTESCNLRCVYCMPEDVACDCKPTELLSADEIIKVAKSAVKLGVNKFRITGGEPLVRRDLCEIIKGIHDLKEGLDIALTTNGILLEEMAEKLKENGLNRINISLDTLDEKKYKEITRYGDLNKVIRGIKKCHEVGIKPIKINVVLLKGFNSEQIQEFMQFEKENDVIIRFIELMPIGEGINYVGKYFMKADEIVEKYDLKKTDYKNGSGPADYYMDKEENILGFINPLSHSFCSKCSRIRLTADGKLKPCLHSDIEYDIKEQLKQGDDAVLNRLHEVIYNKPEKHEMQGSKHRTTRNMVQIGG